MVAEPVLIDRETLRRADWSVINNQIKDLYDTPEEAIDGLADILDFAENCGVRRNAADKMIKGLSSNRKCKLGIMMDQEEIRFA